MNFLPLPILQDILILVVKYTTENPPSKIRRDVPALLLVCKKFKYAIENRFLFWEHSLISIFLPNIPEAPKNWKILYVRSKISLCRIIIQV